MQTDKMCLKDTISEFNYNVQKVRFLAAILVIISHAYPISCLGKDPLIILTKGGRNFGSLSVYTFLFLGGLYTTRSYRKDVHKRNSREFLISRVKRLCPGLLITTVITVFIIGSLFTSLTIKEYLLDKKTWKYFLNCFFIIQHKLPGVFESNMYNASINGSLWTLPLELLCYCAVTILFRIRILSEKKPIGVAFFQILLGQLIICYVVNNIGLLKRYQYHLHLCLVFFLGAVCYLYKEKIYLNKYMQMISIGIIPVLIYFNVTPYIWIFLFLYFILVFCFSDTGTSNVISSLGKYSYEIYLIGFLIQQCVCYFFGGSMNPYINMAISIPIAVVVGILINKAGILLLSKLKNKKDA